VLRHVVVRADRVNVDGLRRQERVDVQVAGDDHARVRLRLLDGVEQRGHLVDEAVEKFGAPRRRSVDDDDHRSPPALAQHDYCGGLERLGRLDFSQLVVFDSVPHEDEHAPAVGVAVGSDRRVALDVRLPPAVPLAELRLLECGHVDAVRDELGSGRGLL